METFAPSPGDRDDGRQDNGGQRSGAAVGWRGTDCPKPVIPGFVPVRELGRGASATVWLAREERSGTGFAVKCLFPGTEAEEKGVADPADAKSSLLREVHLLSRLDHEHLVRLRGVVQLAGSFDGGLGLVMDYAPGGSLGQLVSTRGRLSVGETITVLTPLAQALAYLHRQGMTHSDVAPGNVLFTAQGKPLLSDLGVSRMVGDVSGLAGSGTPGFADPGVHVRVAAELQPERDTYALAALGWYCLTGSAPDITARRPPLTLLIEGVPAALAAALEAGLHPDGNQRPSTAEFGIAVYRSAAPAPLDLSGSVHATVVPELLTRRRAPKRSGKGARIAAFVGRFRSPPGRRAVPRSARRLSGRRRAAPIVLAFGMLVVAGSATAAWWAAHQGPGSGNQVQGSWQQTQSPTPTPGQQVPSQQVPGQLPTEVLDRIRSQDPEEAVRGLSAVRDAAFSTGELELLERVNVQGSGAAAADGKVRDGLRAAGLVLVGFSTKVVSSSLEGIAGPDRATVVVAVETSAYEERDASGKVVRVRPASSRKELRVVLLRGAGEWRIAEILAKQA
ncbi:serine/threonine protein kinase [Arthrobacter sp. NA-172]|uniref:serine/threonine protein kinase n=1 Tax=Arthrobacter sp. NA-172 TaxID=3367524 RepID=UPI0037547CC4